MLETLIAAFETIEDPRCGWKVEHRLLDILVIAVCAVLGEAEASRTSPSTAAASGNGWRASSRCRTAFPRTTPSGGC